MARPKVDPDAPATPKTPDEAIAQGLISVEDVDVKQPHDLTLQTAIENAAVLLEEKKGLLERIGKVRELCTLLVESGIGDRDQVAWVRFRLPRKTRKTANGEEVEDTEGTEDE
jgi:hypothetical protein